jgi:subtilase family protein
MLSLLLSLPFLAPPSLQSPGSASLEPRIEGQVISLLLGTHPHAFEALLETAEGAELLSGSRLLRANRLGIHDLRLPADADARQLAERLAELPDVESAWVPGRGTWLEVPNDPSYAEQWHLSNDGSGSGVVGADVRAEDAWAISTGDPSVVIAILDSGVEITHPDLAPNIWHNVGETLNGVDDDGNGFIDDLDGWDFFHDDGDVTGPLTHGTQVAGFVSARPNDGFGVAGLAGGWSDTPGCRVMAVPVGDSFPDSSVIDDAILYAIDNGARIINLSLSVPSNLGIDLALADAVLQDVLVVAASGNNGSFVTYPASHPDVMAVAATSNDDTVASFSGPGPEVEIAAPGDSVLSTSGTSGTATGVGTSFASPLVCAAAGLLFSRLPALSALEARAILIATAVDIEAPGPDFDSGAGRLDAAAALELLEASDCDGNGLYDPSELAADASLDLNLNGIPDLCELGTPFCFGEVGGPVACPCGNHGQAGAGCANSSGFGARTTASGSAMIAEHNLTLLVSGARAGQPGVFVQGLGLTALPFKDGILCAGNPTERLQFVTTSATGDAASTIDVATAGNVTPGDTAYYQLWYRDPVVSPCGNGSNFSSGFAIDWI